MEYTIYSKALIGTVNNTAMPRPTLGGMFIPMPSSSNVEPILMGQEHTTLGGVTRREVTGRKYKYNMSWDYISNSDYDILERVVNDAYTQGGVLLFTYAKWPQSAPGTQVIATLSSRDLKYGAGTRHFTSETSLTLTEVYNRI